jgi:hypothetical protein
MESMEARKNVELFVEDSSIAKITHLTWINCNVLMPLLPLLFSQNFSVSTMLLKLLLKYLIKV